NGVVTAPWPIDLAVEQVLAATGRLELVDHHLDVLDAILARDQGGIRGVDDDQVLDADGRHQPTLRGPYQTAGGVHRNHVALVAVAIGIVFGHRPQRGPRT